MISRQLSVVLTVAVVACGSVATGGAAPSDTVPSVGSVVAQVHVLNPMGLLVTRGAVWVAAHRSGFVYRINTATNGVVAKIKVVDANGGGPGRMVSSGNRVIEANYLYKSIAFINPATNKAKVTTVRFENCCLPVMAAGSLWVLGYSSSLPTLNPDRLSRVDPKTGRVTATLTIPNADGLVYGAGSLWGWSDKKMIRLDASSGKTVGQFPAPTGPAAFADGSIWSLENDDVNNTATLRRFDPATGSVVASIDLPDLAQVARAGPDGTIWVAEESGLPHPHLWKVDPATNTLAGQVDLGNVTSGIEDLAVAPDGTVWASLFDKNLVLRIKPG